MGARTGHWSAVLGASSGGFSPGFRSNPSISRTSQSGGLLSRRGFRMQVNRIGGKGFLQRLHTARARHEARGGTARNTLPVLGFTPAIRRGGGFLPPSSALLQPILLILSIIERILGMSLRSLGCTLA